jgi:predicted nucleic acid-binding protein
MIATARSGKARFIVTNDRDLLEIPTAEEARLRLQVVTPQAFVAIVREGG